MADFFAERDFFNFPHTAPDYRSITKKALLLVKSTSSRSPSAWAPCIGAQAARLLQTAQKLCAKLQF